MRSLLPLLRYQVRIDMLNRYSGSILGAYWSVINPLMQVGVYVFIFSIVFKVKLGGTENPYEYTLFCLSGLGAWFSFQEALSTSVSSISRNAAIIKNVTFPAELFPTSSVICSFVTLGITYSTLLLLRGIDGELPNISLLALPLVILVHVLFCLGLGLFLAVIGAFFRDISQMLPIILQLWMLSTPVLYQRSDVPASLQFLTAWNPLFYIIESYRQILYYGNWPDWTGLILVGLVGLGLTVAGFKLIRLGGGYFESVV